MSDYEELKANRDRAHRVFTELLTGVPEEVKAAMVALYDLIRYEQQLASHK